MSNDLMPYSGIYNTEADEKGRIVIPSEIRSVFMQRSPYPGFWAMYDKFKGAPYLLCYDIAYFSRNKPLLDMEKAGFCKVESQGRATLKEWMETIANIRDKMIIAASRDGDTFEIWNPESFADTHEMTTLDKIIAATRRIIRA